MTNIEEENLLKNIDFIYVKEEHYDNNQKANNNNNSFKLTKKHNIYLFIILAITSIVLELIYREALFNLTFSLVKYIRKLFPSKNHYIYLISSIYSSLPSNKIIMPTFIIIYNYCNLINSILFIFMYFLKEYTVSIFKLIYHNPRPFWSDNLLIIDNANIEYGFGNPSGHSFGAMIMGLTIYKLFVSNNIYVDNLFKKNSFMNKYMKYFILLYIVITIILIAISRVVLAMHSLNQILLGLCLGYLFYFLIFNIILYNKNLCNYDLFDLLYRIGLFKNKAFKNIFILFLFNIIVTIIIFILSYDKKFLIHSLKLNFDIYSKVDFTHLLYNSCLSSAFNSISIIGVFLAINLEYIFVFNYRDDKFYKYNFSNYNSTIDNKEDTVYINDIENKNIVVYLNNYKNKTIKAHDNNNQDIVSNLSNKDIDTFFKYNYLSKDKDYELEQETDLIKKSINKGTFDIIQWNITSKYISIIRLLTTISLCIIISNVFKFNNYASIHISKNILQEDIEIINLNIIFSIFVKSFVPSFVLLFYLFFLHKIILKKIGLCNDTNPNHI